MRQNYRIYKSKKIFHSLGNLTKLIDKTSSNFYKFGEAYLTEINYKKVKGWKKHKIMKSNIFLISGKVEFQLIINNHSKKIILDKDYNRLFINNNIFFSFKGLSRNKTILLNISTIKHLKSEQISLPYNKISPLNTND